LDLFAANKNGCGTLADGFKKYLEYDPEAKLALGAFADERARINITGHWQNYGLSV